MVMNLDFAPLFLDYAGIATPSYMQGESFRKNLIAQLKKELQQLKEKYDDQDSKYPEMVELNKKHW
jgi:hypothetical protein